MAKPDSKAEALAEALSFDRLKLRRRHHNFLACSIIALACCGCDGSGGSVSGGGCGGGCGC